MLGTAFPANRILLVEQLAGWGLGGLGGSRFDQRIAAQADRRVGQPGHPGAGGAPTRQVRPGRRAALGVRRLPAGPYGLAWGGFETESELLDLDPAELATRAVDTRPVYAVCTHGTHDTCCAIEGRPVAAALVLECPGRVWECSHVGGDRFAANVLVLPTGQLYGRVTDPAALAAATEAGRVLPEGLRGQIGLPPAAQAAVVYVQRERGLTEPGLVGLLGVAGDPAGAQQVTAAAAGRALHGRGAAGYRRSGSTDLPGHRRPGADQLPGAVVEHRGLTRQLETSPDLT